MASAAARAGTAAARLPGVRQDLRGVALAMASPQIWVRQFQEETHLRRMRLRDASQVVAGKPQEEAPRRPMLEQVSEGLSLDRRL